MADIKEAIRRLIYQYTVEGADKVMATQEAVAASTSKTDKASLSLEKAFGGLERRYVDTVRAQQDYAKVQEKVNAAVAQNPALQERANVVLGEARKHFDNVATGAGKADMAATVLIRTMSRTLGPLALVGVAVAGISSAMEFMEPIAVRVGTDIYRRFSEAYPAIAGVADGISKVAKEFYETERASAKIEAINAAWKGVASSAELAALKIETANQKQVNQRGAAEAELNQQRIADHVMRLREIYPGVTQEIAKQLELLDAQLGVAKARTDEERQIAEEILRQVQLRQQGIRGDEQGLTIARERAIADAKKETEARKDNVYYSQNQTAATNEQYKAQSRIVEAVNDTTSGYRNMGTQIQADNQWIEAHNAALAQAQNIAGNLANEYARIPGIFVQIVDHLTDIDVIMHGIPQFKLFTDPNTGQKVQFNPEGYVSSYDPLFSATQKAGLEQVYGAENVEPYYAGVGNALAGYRVKQDYLKAQQPAMIGGMDISTPGAASQALANTLALGLQDGLGNITRVIEAVADPSTQASLVQQAINYIMSTQPPNLAREEMINTLNSKLQGLISSTDSLNSTMQQALSPFYSQDPRTTHLGFRAGVVGNPEWMVGGASNTNPLAAILGAGATAPGMAGGGSFMVGGGYSANDNRIAAFPVASGEQVVVNRNRKGGEGGQVIHIDARTIINGRVDADVFAQMKVSKYQQTQRMRAGLAVA